MSKHSFRSILKSVTIFAFIILLTACEGFFTNNDLDDKIRAAIDYANTPFSSFIVSADSGTGTIIPSGQVQYKPTDLHNIEFTCNSNYEFIEWAFNYKQTSQASGTVNVTATDPNWWKPFIEIIKDEKEESVKNGQIVYTYKLQIQFKSAVENLLIQPRCGKKPMVESFYPDAPTEARSVSRDNDINITFDSVLDPETIPNSITIRNNGVDCTPLFAAPVLQTTGEGSNQKSMIILSPINTLECPAGGTAKITVELSSNIKTTDGVALTAQTLFYYINDISSVLCYVTIVGTYEGGLISPFGSPYEYGLNQTKSLTFTENPGYKFLHWECNNSKILFVPNDVSQNPINFRSIEEVERTANAEITPVYIQRPAYIGATYSVLNASVQPRDTDITLNFDIPDGAELVIPDDADFAIECPGKGSVKLSFADPVVDSNSKNKINIIAHKDSRRIQVTENVTSVFITIPDSIYYVYHDTVTNKNVNVTLGKSVKVTYSIDSSTQDKANVSYSRKNGENVVGNLFIDNVIMTPEESAQAVINYVDDNISLKFEPNSSYEFLYWDVTGDSNTVQIEDKFSTQTSFTVKAAGTVTIYPKCAPKLTATLAIPDEFKKDSNYFSDSDIWIETNIAPQDFDANNQNGNSYNSITVTFNNTNVTSNYKSPQIVTENGKNYIKLEALNKLPVPAGSSAMTVSVRIDGTLYYNSPDTVINDYLGSDKKIYIKDNGTTLTFNVIEDTKNKVYVKIVSSTGVTVDTTAFDSRYKAADWSEDNKLYLLNENSDFELLNTPDDNYQFIDWTIKTKAGGVVDASISKITKTTLYGIKTNTLNVLKMTENSSGSTSGNPVIITAVCKPKLTATFSPVNELSDGDLVPVARDSNIIITFNEAPDSSIKNNIKIFCDGKSANSNFNINGATFDETGKILTILSQTSNRISVSSGETKTISIQIPKKSYYTFPLNGEDHNVTCADDIEYEYIIDETTTKKAKVTFVVYDDEGTLCNAGGDIYLNSVNKVTKNTVIPFNIDALRKDIHFVASDDYKFKNWIITNSNTNSIQFGQTDSSVSEFTLKEEDENIVIKAIVEKRYRVAEFTPADTEGGVPCDSSIKMKFNWDVNTRWVWNNPLDGISIKLGNTSIMDCFNTEQVYYDRENLTLEIKSKYDGSFNKYFTSSYLTVTVTIGAPLVDIPEEHTYMINRETEKIPPKLEDVYVFNDSEGGGTCILSDYVNYATGDDAIENIKKNVVSRLYIGACAWDDESGLKSFIIKEQLVRSVEGNEITNAEIYTTTAINFYTGTPYADIDDWLCGENYYEFKSPQDGVVRIELILEDLFGNTTSKSFEVVKNSIITPIELVGVGSLKPYSSGTYTYKYDQSPVEFNNSTF